jgi:putative ABC transport system permease protein
VNVVQQILEALESLASSKVRSGLTMLGIVIGVAAVVAMMAIGAGAQNSITEQINSIGTNLLYVMPGGDSDHPVALTLEDAQAMANPKLAPSVSKVAPVLRQQVDVSIPGANHSTSLMGVTPEFFQVQKADLAEGQLISSNHIDNFASVVLLGSEVAQQLFDRKTGLVGESVRIQGQIFQVIGILKEQGGTGFGNNDDRVLIPLTTAQLRSARRESPDEVDMIYVQAVDSNSVKSAEELVTQILRSRHNTADGKDDFSILSTQAFLETASAVTGVMTVFLGGIAGVSLLVGGIGIMNIMLVTVTERTREIGLRKAVGARKNDIRLQFLVESSLLSLSGGLIGVLVGWGISILVGKIATSTGTALNPVVQANAVLLATLFSAAVGIFFGIYPANRAANLEPVEALRSE